VKLNSLRLCSGALIASRLLPLEAETGQFPSNELATFDWSSAHLSTVQRFGVPHAPVVYTRIVASNTLQQERKVILIVLSTASFGICHLVQLLTHHGRRRCEAITAPSFPKRCS
jgi:hypothetical protein